MKRAERALFYGEQTMARAIDNDDARLGLAALDRVKASLDQLMRVHGLLQPDGMNVTIDKREQNLAIIATLSEEEIRQLIAGGTGPNQ